MSISKSFFIPVALFLMAIPALSQEQQLISKARLILKKGDTAKAVTFSNVLISLQNGSSDFKATVDLFPVVPDKDIEDSLQQQRRPLALKLSGRFPVDNVEFLTIADNGRNYQMDVSASINDSVRNSLLHFGLLLGREEPIDPNGSFPRYQARISFAFAVDPRKFGLTSPPFNIQDMIVVEVSGAVINKID